MIKQDNRSQTDDIFDKRIENLRRMLNDDDDNVSPVQNSEPPPCKIEETEIENKQPPAIFINGNNNVITTGKSKNICIKGSFFTVTVLCLLFF